MRNRSFNLTLVLAAALTAGFVQRSSPATAQPIVFAPHRAIYDLKLAQTRGKRSIQTVRGRILYDFTGSPCDGYALQFRQVSELDSGEGKVTLSDLRATTWEDGDAKGFRFNSQNFVNEKPAESVDGRAERGKDGVVVKLGKPRTKTFDLEAAIAFPTEHMRRIVEAARQGKTILELPVYDGSENGEKVYSTLTVIGHEIAPNEKKPTDAAAAQPALAAMRRWPVTVSYFDRAVSATSGEQTPVYAIGFELYENGISRALTLDYGDFVVAGEMSQLEIKTTAACR
jgi:hypothetical protein